MHLGMYSKPTLIPSSCTCLISPQCWSHRLYNKNRTNPQWCHPISWRVLLKPLLPRTAGCPFSKWVEQAGLNDTAGSLPTPSAESGRRNSHQRFTVGYPDSSVTLVVISETTAVVACTRSWYVVDGRGPIVAPNPFQILFLEAALLMASSQLDLKSKRKVHQSVRWSPWRSQEPTMMKFTGLCVTGWGK